ncbi:3998_t:CDS:2, partial [Dentiscutata erythropus]
FLEYIEIQFAYAENDFQFEEKLTKFLSHVLKELASPHEIARKKGKTIKMMISDMAFMIYAMEILNHIKKRMTKAIKLPWNLLAELVYSENFMRSALVKNFTIVFFKMAYDCLTEKKKGADFIQWITRKADTSIVELIGKVLLFSLLKIIKETRIENFNNLMREEGINQTLSFKPFYGSPDLSIENSEEDNENLKVIVIKFRELDQLDQFSQWMNEENVQEIINILEESNDEQPNIAINDNFKLSDVINDKDNYSKEIYTDQFYKFTTSQSIINHLESNEDSLIINFREFS